MNPEVMTGKSVMRFKIEQRKMLVVNLQNLSLVESHALNKKLSRGCGFNLH